MKKLLCRVGWTSRADKETKDRQRRQVFDMWLACYTQDEIAEAVGWGQKTVNDFLNGFSGKPQMRNSAKTHKNGDRREEPFLTEARLTPI